jgi:hypothetical protein
MRESVPIAAAPEPSRARGDSIEIDIVVREVADAGRAVAAVVVPATSISPAGTVVAETTTIANVAAISDTPAVTNASAIADASSITDTSAITYAVATSNAVAPASPTRALVSAAGAAGTWPIRWKLRRSIATPGTSQSARTATRALHSPATGARPIRRKLRRSIAAAALGRHAEEVSEIS